MKKRTFFALAGIIALVGIVVACGGDNTTSPSEPSITVATAPTPAPASPGESSPNMSVTPSTPCPPGAYAWSEAGMDMCEVSNTFASKLGENVMSPAQLKAAGYHLVREVFINNKNSRGAESKAVLFTDPKGLCSSTQSTPKKLKDLIADGVVSGAYKLNATTSGVIKYELNLTPETCGCFQLDDTWDVGADVGMGKVVSTGIDCPSCETTVITITHSVTAQTDTTITYKFIADLPGTFTGGDTQTFAKTDTDTTKTVQFISTERKCPATDTVPIPAKKKACADYTAPSITGDISSDIQSTQVVFDKGSVAPSSCIFSPILPKSIARPDEGQPAGSFSTTCQIPYGPENLQCSVSKTFTKPVPPKEHKKVCTDYPAPIITLTPHTTPTPTLLTVTSITASPAGGTFNPTLPQAYPRPAYGQPSQTKTFTYNMTYHPGDDLSCSASKTVDVTVPPQGCAPVYTWTGEFAITSLSNSGNGYYITDDGADWQTGLNLTAGSHLSYSYPHAVDNSKLCLRWPVAGTSPVYRYTQYWEMNQGTENARENACENRGGVWLDDYNIPGDGTNGHRHNVCKFTFSSNPAGAPGADMTLYNPPGTVQTLVSPGTPPSYEQIGCANATCSGGEASAKWHGSVEFKCTKHNSCDAD